MKLLALKAGDSEVTPKWSQGHPDSLQLGQVMAELLDHGGKKVRGGQAVLAMIHLAGP